MNFLSFTCFVVVQLMQCISSVNSCECTCEKETPLKLIFQIIPHFKEIHSCNRTFITNYGASNDGVRHISYQGELNKNESPIDICSCVYSYLSQKDWLEGSIQSCCVRENIVTMTIEGEPDPTFNKETNNSSMDDPLELLKAVFDQFPFGEFQNHYCRPRTRKDKSGDLHFEIQCDLRPDSPCKDELCEGILRYLNQDNWLGELTSKCTSDGNVLDMEILGKLDQ